MEAIAPGSALPGSDEHRGRASRPAEPNPARTGLRMREGAHPINGLRGIPRPQLPPQPPPSPLLLPPLLLLLLILLPLLLLAVLPRVLVPCWKEGEDATGTPEQLERELGSVSVENEQEEFEIDVTLLQAKVRSVRQ